MIDFKLARRAALILGLNFATFSTALADGRAVLPPRWMVDAYLSDALVKPSRDDIARAIIPGLGASLGFMAGRSAPDVAPYFNAQTYTGNGSSRTIATGIDLSTFAGFTWVRRTNSSSAHVVASPQFAGSYLTWPANSYTTNASTPNTFSTTGYSIGTDGLVNTNSQPYHAITFRDNPGFMRVLTWAGNGSTGRQIAHGLGSAPGLIFIKRLGTSDWVAWHKNFVSSTHVFPIISDALPTTGVASFLDAAPDAIHITITANTQVNGSGVNYVAFVFADDTTSEGIIRCTHYTGNGSTTGPSVNLGWEPQFVMIKRVEGNIGDWLYLDAARGFNEVGYMNLNFQSTFNVISPTSSGFNILSDNSVINNSGHRYIVLAVRKP